MPGDDVLRSVWTMTPGGSDPDRLAWRIEPETHQPASAFPIADIAGATVTAATLAALEVGEERGLRVDGLVSVETDHALAAWRSHLRVDGEAPPMWAELSGLYPTADDRFVQLHCNFPHHAAGVVARLATTHSREAVAEAILGWNAFELEDVLRTDGMICAAYRTLDEWDRHPHAIATADLPLVDVEQLGDGPARELGSDPERPLSGVRVLDCSRVLAGPVCGRTLAAHGADVLRVGAAHLPAVDSAVIVTGFGKRNTQINLATAEGRERFTALLAQASVFVDAYRPGALAAHGFSAERVAEINPGIVVVEVCAFDWTGPWAGRRGFDSIVQSTTGIAMSQAELVDSPTPVHLPVQALDYATGYLAAFVASRLVAHQQRVGGGWRARLSLLRTRNWLVGLGGPVPFVPSSGPAIDRYLHNVESEFGTVTAVRPVAGRWDLPPSRLDSGEPVWV